METLAVPVLMQLEFKPVAVVVALAQPAAVLQFIEVLEMAATELLSISLDLAKLTVVVVAVQPVDIAVLKDQGVLAEVEREAMLQVYQEQLDLVVVAVVHKVPPMHLAVLVLS
jgi:hypothetical protein